MPGRASKRPKGAVLEGSCGFRGWGKPGLYQVYDPFPLPSSSSSHIPDPYRMSPYLFSDLFMDAGGAAVVMGSSGPH